MLRVTAQGSSWSWTGALRLGDLTSMSAPRVVVTGATGLLGRAVIRQLKARDPAVDVVGVSRREGLGHLWVPDYSQTPEGDVLVHLAEASDRSWVERAGNAYVLPALALIETLARRSYRHIVYASSAVLYGDQSEKLHGVDDPIFVRDRYSELKARSEKVVLSSGGTSARLCNLYGFGMRAENVANKILAQIPGKGPLRVFDASPSRDFLWIDDAAAAVAAMALRPSSGLYNVGTGIRTSVADFARIALTHSNQADRPVLSERPHAGLSCIVVDASETETVYGWKPTHSIDLGISLLVANKLKGAQ